MDLEHASIDVADRIITITLHREAKLNAIGPEITRVLWQATDALAANDDLRCMVITARGRYFSAGIDLSDPPVARSEAPAAWAYRREYRAHHRLYDEIETIEKPVILAAQGPIIGAGVEMAVSCDFRFCTPRTEWGLPEVGFGAIAGSGGSSRLTRLVGPAWAKYIAMAGMRISADRAHAIGLVHDVFPEETFMREVYAFCAKLIAFPADALGLAKLAIDLAADITDRGAQRHVDRLINATLVGSDSFLERAEPFTRQTTGERDDNDPL